MRDGFISKITANPSRVIGPRTPLALLIILPAAVIIHFYLSFFENALIDDAFITMQYAKTLLESGTWGFFPNHVSNSATSPLNVILLALTAFVTGSIMDAVKWLTLINFLLIFILLRKISIKSLNTEIFGFVSFAALAFNPLLLSTIRMDIIYYVFYRLNLFLSRKQMVFIGRVNRPINANQAGRNFIFHYISGLCSNNEIAVQVCISLSCMSCAVVHFFVGTPGFAGP